MKFFNLEAIVLLAILIYSSGSADAAEPLTEKDFFWSKATKPHKSTIVKGVNKIRRDNHLCYDLDPMSASLSGSKSTKANPVFYVTCGQGTKMFNVYFSKKDIDSKKSFNAASHINKTTAIRLCEDYAKQHSTHPSTTNFSRVIDVNLTEHPNGRSRLVSTFTTQNSFGTKLKFKISCLLDEHGLIEAAINEDR